MVPRLSWTAGSHARTVGLVLAAVAFIALAFVVLGAVGFRFDPFDLQSRRIERSEAKLATTTAQAAASDIEVSAARDTTARVEIALTQTAAAHERLTDFAVQTRNAPDATQPLDPDRIDRLRDFDQQLCAIRPGICAGSTDSRTATPDAADSQGSLPTGRASPG